ncbi:MAG: hypothetical protein ACXABD_21840, partial [Candidatus Thorarchaeota archaeon]
MNHNNFDRWILEGRYWVRLSDGFRLLVIQGGGAANTVQNDVYAFGDDDNNEATHTLDTENTDRTAQAADVTFLFRTQVEETAGGTENKAYALFAQKNGAGGFIEVTTGSANGIIIADDTQSRADNENTTERLSYSGGGTFTAGKYDDGQVQRGTTTVSLDTQYTDFEFAIQIDSANAVDGDDFELRVEFENGTDLDGYPGTYPTVTASLAAPQTVNLNTLQLQSNTPDINVQAGAAIVSTDTLEVNANAPQASIQVPPISVSVNTLLLRSFVNNSVVVAGTATISVDALLLNAFAQGIVISPSAVSMALDTLLLQSIIQDISIGLGASTVSLDTLLLSSSTPNII